MRLLFGLTYLLLTASCLKAVHKTAAMADNAAHKTAEVTGNTAHKTAEITDNTAHKTAEATGNTAHKTAEIADKTADKTGEIADNTKHKTAEIADKTADKTTEVVDKTADKTGEIADKTKHKTTEITDKTAHKTAEIADNALTAVTNIHQQKILHGFSWYGFNIGTTMVEGLSIDPKTLSDFATVVYRQQLLGFNAVRLPFSFKDLSQLTPRSFTGDCHIPSASDVAQSTLLPGEHLPSIIPPQKAPVTNDNPSLCNAYLPADSTFNRFIWVIRFFTQNGFTVLLDNHREDPTVLQDTNIWVKQWVKLAKAVYDDAGIAKDRIMFDLLNEPDGFGILWDKHANKPALAQIYLQAMDAIEAVAPHSTYVLEGTGQGGIHANWGDGFCTNAQLIKKHRLSDPRPFLQTLKNKSYVSRVILSPHVYGPGVTYNHHSIAGEALWHRLTASFGTLNKSGYLGVTYPIAIGEFGSTFSQADDRQTMFDLATYLNQSNSQHNRITMWFYWAWNTTSGDTGGLVKSDWQTLETEKIAFLRTLGLKPFRY